MRLMAVFVVCHINFKYVCLQYVYFEYVCIKCACEADCSICCMSYKL